MSVLDKMISGIGHGYLYLRFPKINGIPVVHPSNDELDDIRDDYPTAQVWLTDLDIPIIRTNKLFYTLNKEAQHGVLLHEVGHIRLGHPYIPEDKKKDIYLFNEMAADTYAVKAGGGRGLLNALTTIDKILSTRGSTVRDLEARISNITKLLNNQ